METSDFPGHSLCPVQAAHTHPGPWRQGWGKPLSGLSQSLLLVEGMCILPWTCTTCRIPLLALRSCQSDRHQRDPVGFQGKQKRKIICEGTRGHQQLIFRNKGEIFFFFLSWNSPPPPAAMQIKSFRMEANSQWWEDTGNPTIGQRAFNFA